MAEVVRGRRDGRPMLIRRHGKSGEMTLSARKVDPNSWTYSVAKGGRRLGGGRMTLIDDGKSWVEVTQGSTADEPGLMMVFTRAPNN